MVIEPPTKRVLAFFDGQNLFHGAREAFGCTYPNYCPISLATRICSVHSWSLQGIRFYTGIPDLRHDAFWFQFWTAKLGTLGHRGISVYSRPLRYRKQELTLPDGTTWSALVAQEKGIDVRIALDVIRMARQDDFDVAVLFSQDQDFSELADEIRSLSREQKRWIKLASAYPISPASINRRGINGTDWIKIDRTTYDACIDHKDYRPKRTP
jgi:uncharacterized LabA/DUF88 family protein